MQPKKTLQLIYLTSKSRYSQLKIISTFPYINTFIWVKYIKKHVLIQWLCSNNAVCLVRAPEIGN